jgi:hypothetical protein
VLSDTIAVRHNCNTIIGNHSYNNAYISYPPTQQKARSILRPSTLHSLLTSMSKPYPPLYEPGAPPPALFVLTSQTDIFYNNPLRSSTVTANEELPPNLQTKRHRSVPPVSTASSLVRFHSVPVRQNDSICEDSDSSLTSLSNSGSDMGASDGEGDTDESDEEGNNKIPKPPGEAGRPGRGGYTLRVALRWNTKDYKKLQVCINTLSSSRCPNLNL